MLVVVVPLTCNDVNVPAVPFIVVPLIAPLLVKLLTIAAPVEFNVAVVVLALVIKLASCARPAILMLAP